ncbi:hypothetical protein GKKCFE_15980 [Pseudomonas sp. E141]|jgi:hypothetical protein|uniref:Uncharacterized protein n=1 Tax=Pseudomonas rhizophila TaxID=2045200 RepID=A0ABN5K183_9PSED|nr:MULTISPECIES: hypothetical protein [Pseudomonas]AVU77151.1 hypothetical protein CRX69_18855 [Pseudomonas rhizophila]MBD0702308.1 hypothetical protein [Pseudomonas sp. PSB1]MDR8385949.1 hypothetical protein [Pseudomonas sp. JL2]MEA1028235.1 hypothetical protein [Pseudomonas sp. N-137]QKJ35336.1 hypothetical protein HQ912_11025 [Pseudomonas sp. MPDS]
MKRQLVPVIKDGQREEVVLDVNAQKSTILLTFKSGWSKKYSGADVYECLGKIIKEHTDIKFLCKGAKLSVRPSSMSSQMSSGIAAYEHVLGKRASRADLVNIFDYEDRDIVSDPQLQKDYFFLWLESIKNVDE